MPYISELLHNKVSDSSDAVVGRLEDILINPKNGSFSPLELLLIKKSADKSFVYVPYSYVENFTSRDISLKNLFAKIVQEKLPDNKPYVYLKRDILDRQIVDTAGSKVVRVNDLRIGYVEDKMCVLGIDSSFRGLLRRLGLEGSFIAKAFPVNLIDWRQAELIGSGPLQLNTVAENLSRLHPADLANVVEELGIKQGSSLLASLGATEAAKVMEELDPKLQNILVKYLGPDTAGSILAQMSSDEIADLVKSFSSEEAKSFLSKVEALKAKKVEKLAVYPDDTAGGLMTLDFISARPSWTVQQTIEEIRKVSATFRSVVFIYMTEEDGRFRGVVSLRRLLLADPVLKMGKLTKAVPMVSTLKPEDKMRKIIRIMTKYNLYAATVIDQGGKLAGVVTIDDVMRQLFPRA